jgi:Cytochrome c554 and c-prime
MTATRLPNTPRDPEARRVARPRRSQQWAWSIVIVIVVSAICGPTSRLIAKDEAAPPAKQPWRLVGVGSCTAAGCHGAGHTDRTFKSEYNVWISQDPHARAYSILFDERSQRITELLSSVSKTPTPPAQENPRCLACHSMTGTPPLDKRIDVISDGVGCEACHGPAEGWLALHTEHKLSAQERQQLGMWDTKRLLVRAQVCVGCHVGGPGRDVNHDLIAAGHPRLRFEMTSFLEAMPKHWDENRDRAEHPNFDTLSWAIGQACTSQAALAQLANRADRGTNWPEFAEWSCTACHHDLRGDESRQARLAKQGNLSGRRITWDAWNYFATRQHAPEIGRAFGLNDSSAIKVQNGVQQLDHQMQRLNPDRHEIALTARQASDAAGDWAAALEHASLDRPRLDQLTRALVARQSADGLHDWSTAAQMYDALASLHQSRLELDAAVARAPSPADDRLTAAIAAIYADLVAKGSAQAHDQVDSETIRQQLNDVQQLLPPERSAP